MRYISGPAADPYSDIQTRAEQVNNPQLVNLHIFMPRTVPRWKNYLIVCKTGPIFPLRYRPGSNHARKGAPSRGKDAFPQSSGK
jgi:hypothetical protein